MLRRAGYDPEKTKFLVEGFYSGFDIGYQGPEVRQSKSQNIHFSVGDDKDLWLKLMKEFKLKRVAGPFITIPFKNFIQSPIGLVPKDEGRKTRLIFHLSYEFKDGMGSLNWHTPDYLCSVHYNDLDHAVNNCLALVEKLIKENPNGPRPTIFFRKTDVQSTFRILGLKKECWKWLVMMAKNPDTGETFFFVDNVTVLSRFLQKSDVFCHCSCIYTLPFGASRSCALFQAFSDALHFLLEYITKLKKQTTNYLDDYLLLAATQLICDYLIQSFLDLCQRLNVPILMEKTHWSSPLLVFLGILLNSYALTLGIPLEKKQRALSMINMFIDKHKATVHEVQSLCGFLNFLNKAIFPGRTFTCRMYPKYSDIVNKVGVGRKLKAHHHVTIDQEFKSDCHVWKTFLELERVEVVNHPMVDLSLTHTADEIFFYSDASANKDLGFGCVYKNRWIFERWEPGFMESKKSSIEYLELFGFCAGILTWERFLKNCRITVFCDNQSVVYMVNKGSSSCKNCMYLIWALTLNGLQFNRCVFA